MKFTLDKRAHTQDVILQELTLKDATLRAVGARKSAIRARLFMVSLLGQFDELRAATAVCDEFIIA